MCSVIRHRPYGIIYLDSKSTVTFQKVLADHSLSTDVHMRIGTVVSVALAFEKILANRHLKKE
jgi:hypothetical protein